ncbi:hypothetical protein THAOC_34694 [Thalassiosira oceanica]|uniref:THIF-type NAD/FAD binding fold domain-containing protein n=1 Tax=Thalassiosira oceanica TaxID=159749 RepID=K0RC32_THAOC|nr:hypothetical protein THAOC_34694 [Thalassiosira oceanica]|eukprot:EJK46631.1 hypothetical protein THAOC_34694 [Thalassiosira oceanica]
MATTDKYDRQLRLWGANGQRALGSTCVVLVGSSACGTETLKNLVLPGVGSFLVLDDDEGGVDCSGAVNGAIKVESAPKLDESLLKFGASSSNFFLSPISKHAEDDAHQLSSAARSCALLSELNPDVSGYHSTVASLESVDYSSFLSSLMASPPKTSDGGAASKILVIAADQPSTVTLPLSHACYTKSIPLLCVRSYGLLGYVSQVGLNTDDIVRFRSSPLPSLAHRIPDLRLSQWPLFEGLTKVASTVSNLDEMEDTKDHSHVPFVVILLQALDKWRKSVDSGGDAGGRPRYPNTFAEKGDFRKVVECMAKNLNNEINFEEAVREAHLCWADGRVSDDVKMVLDRVNEEAFLGSAVKSGMDVEGTTPLPSHVLQFQLLALALKRFLKDSDGYPPLEGTIPGTCRSGVFCFALL